MYIYVKGKQLTNNNHKVHYYCELLFHHPAPPPNGSFALLNTSAPPPNGSFALLNISAYVPVCNEDFYLYSFNSTSPAYCRPLCGEWEEFSPTTTDIMDGIQVAAAYINILGTIIVLILSVILRKRM